MKHKEMKYDNISVLLFGVAGRQGLAMCRGFYKLGCKVTVYCRGKLDTGYLTRFANYKILYNGDNHYNEDFLNYGLRLIKNGKYDLVVPLSDATATFLSQHKIELKRFAKIAVNDWEIFENVIDKKKTMKICEDNNIPAPKTIFSENPDAEIAKLKFPVVVKPRTACGSIGFSIIHTYEELQKYLGAYDNANGPIFIQEYIPQNGPQYGGEIFRDHNGNFTSVLIDEKPRWYPLDGGSPTINITIHNQEMADICCNLLNALNWNGYANVDLVVDSRDKIPKVLEINGRLSAATLINYVAGIDIAKMIIENEFSDYVEPQLDYKDNKAISCFMVDLLWFIKSKDRFNVKPSWLSRGNIKDVIFFWDDLKPLFGFIVSNIKDYKTKMKKRERFKSDNNS